MRFHCLTPADRRRWQKDIVALDQTATYPLGHDFFQLDHGKNYFAFFDRLGKVHYYVALDGARIAAVGCGILRQVAYRQGQPPALAWYLCDLKVHPDYQGQHLSLRLLSHALLELIHNCDRGYLISMNPSDGRPNRFVRVLERFPLISWRCTAQLGLYSLNATTMADIAPCLIEHRGTLAYRSLAGIKDLRLQSTGKTLPLLHLDWHLDWGKPAPKVHSTPQQGYTHMFCVPSTDPLVQDLAQHDLYPQATASVVSYGMADSDWRFVLTSDI